MTATATAFAEAYVDVDGFRIRYLEAGTGPALVWLHGGGGLHLSRAHALLAERHRVVALEVPGFGTSAANERSPSFPALGATMAAAVKQLGIERFNLWGTSFGTIVAVWWAIGD
jgi:pimeloyl-ACP methyl ester carboxylesterase